MNAAGLPTPYDIIPPPGIPFSPSLTAWTVAIIACMLVFLVIWRYLAWLEKKRKPLQANSLNMVIENLQSVLKSGTSDRTTLEHSSLMVKRFLSKIEGRDLTAFSGKEMILLADSTTAYTSAILVALAELEKISYRKELSQAEALKMFQSLVALLLLPTSNQEATP